MKIVGIDYGRRKIGIAVSEGILAEPFEVIRFESEEEALKKLGEVVQTEQVGRIVVGISEGKMAQETRKFGRRLEERLNLPIVFQDETLTTQVAQELSISAGIRRKKRREMEDAYSAALILQAYLDK